MVVPALACTGRTPASLSGPQCDSVCALTRLAASPSVPMPSDSLLPVWTATPDGSEQFTHPSVLLFPSGWHGWRYWLADTPPSAASEDPALFVSDNGRYFVPPTGTDTPLERPDAGAYLSDPDLHLIGGDSIGLVYRETNGLDDELWMATSPDGVSWSRPEELLSDSADADLSPSVVSQPSWGLWAVDAGRDGCSSLATTVRYRASSDGATWEEPAVTDLAVPGYEVWHLDVAYVPSREEYWALVAAYPDGTSCASTDLFLAASADGLHWTTWPSPVLRRGESPLFAKSVYRSTMAVNPASDSVTIWYSGVGGAYQGDWRLAVARFPIGDLLRRVTAAAYR